MRATGLNLVFLVQFSGRGEMDADIKRTFQIEQAESVAQESGVYAGKSGRQITGFEMCKVRIIMAEEDEVIGEDGGKIASQKRMKHEEVMMHKDGNRGTV